MNPSWSTVDTLFTFDLLRILYGTGYTNRLDWGHDYCRFGVMTGVGWTLSQKEVGRGGSRRLRDPHHPLTVNTGWGRTELCLRSSSRSEIDLSVELPSGVGFVIDLSLLHHPDRVT